jgi:N6-L-threonylcarbamoyladenine synthase
VLHHLRRNQSFEAEIETRRQALAQGERSADRLRALSSAATLDLVASFQRSVVSNLLSQTFAALVQYPARAIFVSGGVAANSELRRTFESESAHRGIEVFFPSRALSTDNAAMIAAAGYAHFMAGDRADSTLNAEANLPLS